jgi:signal transduction histidine kinase
LKAHCAEVTKRHNVRVDLDTAGHLGPVHPDIAICFFRIAQEAFRNGIVHGRASRFAVSLARSGEGIELTVSDDGLGFDLDAVRRSGGGLGLVSMEERARSVGGDVEIVTMLGQGTTIRARGPTQPRSAGRPAGDPRASEAISPDRSAVVT